MYPSVALLTTLRVRSGGQTADLEHTSHPPTRPREEQADAVALQAPARPHQSLDAGGGEQAGPGEVHDHDDVLGVPVPHGGVDERRQLPLEGRGLVEVDLDLLHADLDD